MHLDPLGRAGITGWSGRRCLGWFRRLVIGRPDGIRRRIWRRVRRSPAEHAPAAKGAATFVTPPDLAEDGFVAVARLSDVAGLREIRAGGAAWLLARVGDDVFCLPAACAHAGGPLADGHLEGTVVTCPYHGWSYDVRDGSCLVDPSIQLATRPVVIRGDLVCVAVS